MKIKKKQKEIKTVPIKNDIAKNDIRNLNYIKYDEELNLFKTIDDEFIKHIVVQGTNIFGFKEEDMRSLIYSLSRIFSRQVGNAQLYSFQSKIDVNEKIEDYEVLKQNLDLSVASDLAKYKTLTRKQNSLKRVNIDNDMIDYNFIIVIKDKSLNDLNSKANEVVSCLQKTNTCFILDTDESKKILFNYYHPFTSKFSFKKSTINYDFMDLLLPDSFTKVGSGSKSMIDLGGTYCKFKYLASFVKEPSVALLNELVKIPNTDFSMHFSSAGNTDSLNKVLDKNLKSLEKELENTNMKGSARIKLETKQQDVEKMINDVNGSGATGVDFGVYIRVKGETMDEVASIVNYATEHLLSECGVVLRDAIFQQEALFSAVAPICHNTLDKYMKTTTTETLGLMYPLVSESLYDQSTMIVKGEEINIPPILLGKSKGSNGVVFYDNFIKNGERKNYNEFFSGISGSGKTFTLLKLIEERHAIGYKQHIIDIEGKELNKLTNDIGGSVINCGDGTLGRINPLEVRINLRDDDKEDDKKIDLDKLFPLSEHIRFLRTFLSCYKGDSDDIKLLHNNTIEVALEKIYKDVGIDYNTSAKDLIENYDSKKYPIFSDLFNELNRQLDAAKDLSLEEKDLNDILRLKDCIAFIRPLAIGADACIFNGHTNIDISNDLICYNISALQDNSESSILTAQYYNILSFIWTSIISSDGHQRIQIYADEIGIIFLPTNKEVLLYIRNFMKRLRKYLAGISTATQEIHDILKESIEDYGKAVLSNSQYQFHFAMKQEDLQYLKKGNTLPESEENFLLRAFTGECYAKFGNTSLRVKVELDEQQLKKYESYAHG